MEFPGRFWTLLQVQFLLVVAIFGFANMYIKNGGIRYQGAPTIVEQADHKAVDSSSSRVDSGPQVNRIDALYYSVVTFSTVGYGDFTPTSSAARLLVIWQLGTGMLMLLGVFPLIVGRITDF
jgi:voltage-gated potassium channel Kch